MARRGTQAQNILVALQENTLVVLLWIDLRALLAEEGTEINRFFSRKTIAAIGRQCEHLIKDSNLQKVP